MHIPKRYINKQNSVKNPANSVADPGNFVQAIKSEYSTPKNEYSKQAISEINKVMSEIRKLHNPTPRPAPKYVFTMIRDNNGLLEQVVATPVESNTIV